MRTLFAVLCLLLASSTTFAIAGTDQIASPGQDVSEQTAKNTYHWPKGTLKMVNDKRRTVGWNSWFSECPNDVCQFAYALDEKADLQALINLLAKIESKELRIALVDTAEEKPQVKTSKAIGAKLLLGSQLVMNQWYVGLEKRIVNGKEVRVFGVKTYTSVPDATPPTLWIYVRHPNVDLTKLKIPLNVQVDAPYAREADLKAGDDTSKAIAKIVADHEAKRKAESSEKPKK